MAGTTQPHSSGTDCARAMKKKEIPPKASGELALVQLGCSSRVWSPPSAAGSESTWSLSPAKEMLRVDNPSQACWEGDPPVRTSPPPRPRRGEAACLRAHGAQYHIKTYNIAELCLEPMPILIRTSQAALTHFRLRRSSAALELTPSAFLCRTTRRTVAERSPRVAYGMTRG